jgi:hypothetical protein
LKEFGGSINRKTLDEELKRLEDMGDIFATGHGSTYGITN